MLVWCSRAAARASRRNRSSVIRSRGHMPGQHLERHPPAERDLLGLVDDPHASPADLSQNPVIADLLQRCSRSGSFRFAFSIDCRLVDLLDLDHRREELADVVGQLRVAIGVFLERGAFAAPEAVGEFLGQSIEQVILFRIRDRHDHGPSSPPASRPGSS